MTKKIDAKPDDELEDVKPPNGSQDWEQRFRDMATRRREAEKRVLELETEREQFQAAAEGAGALAKRVKELEAEIATKTAHWEQESALRDEGLTDAEARDQALYQYGRLPEADRPKTPAEAVKAWKADITKAPRAMQAYLPAPAARVEAGKADAGKPGAQARPLPRSSTGGAPPPPSGPSADAGNDAASIRAAKQKGAQTGDWTDFRRLTGPAAAKLPERAAEQPE